MHQDHKDCHCYSGHQSEIEPTGVYDSPEELIAGIEMITLKRSEQLHALCRIGLWGLLVFIAATIATWQLTVKWPSCPPSVQTILGAAPSVNLIHLALTAYLLSALMLSITRHFQKTEKYAGWGQIGFMLPFYFFYWYAGTLSDNFVIITASGVALLMIEQIRLYHLCRGLLRHEYEEHSRKVRRLRFLSKS